MHRKQIRMSCQSSLERNGEGNISLAKFGTARRLANVHWGRIGAPPVAVGQRSRALPVGVTVLLTMLQGRLRTVSCLGGLDACFNASNPRLHKAVGGLPLVGRNCPSSQRSRNGGVAVKPSTLAANLPKRTRALCVEEPFGLRKAPACICAAELRDSPGFAPERCLPRTE